ncbi:RNA polymerase sigma-70 factor [Chitinophaga sp.]|uniref:RNA polymerase sigma factor n=1 Tax=Chitinophaga sp. TaxID=1869181 RepID=UPI002F943EB3
MPLPDIFDEPKMLELLVQGDESSFASIFGRYQPKVFGTAIGFLKSAALAEEIVQDVFMKVWLKRAEFGHVKNLEAYLLSMTRHLILDRLKKAAYENNHLKAFTASIPDFTNTTDHRLRNRQCEILLQEAITLLPPQQKQVYQLAKTAGYSHDEIATQMGISRLTVKKHMAVALHRIRQHLGSHISSYGALIVWLFSR